MPKICLALALAGCFLAGQDLDTLQVSSTRRAALWSLIPGGGQVYNRQIVKAVLLVGAEALAVWRFLDNAGMYRTYQNEYPLPRHRYLEKRNKYAWWIGFIYLYGFLDAVVDAHLEPFERIMREDLEQTETSGKTTGGQP